jgi:hypothetical protein
MKKVDIQPEKNEPMQRFGWIMVADAVAKLSKTSGISKPEAARHIIAAARDGVIYTRGRLYHARGHSIAISPAAWEGMDPDPVMSRLCPPNPGLEVQQPFLGAPVVFEVEVHAASFEAWKVGQPRAPAPIMQPITMPSALRHAVLIWHELHSMTESGEADAAGGTDTKAESKATTANTKKPTKRDNVMAMLGELYPDGVPGWSASKAVVHKVNQTMKLRGGPEVSIDTVDRAVKELKKTAHRSPQ